MSKTGDRKDLDNIDSVEEQDSGSEEKTPLAEKEASTRPKASGSSGNKGGQGAQGHPMPTPNLSTIRP